MEKTEADTCRDVKLTAWCCALVPMGCGQSANSKVAAGPDANRAHRPSASESGSFKAFVSHFKAEAAMEARYIQTELEAQADSRCFIDSDDLRDLSLLTNYVKSSECLVLVQSKGVLTRPWVLLELVTAIQAGVPIVGISLQGRPDVAYSFPDALAFLTNLDSTLEATSPGASAVLVVHGIDLLDAAWKLR